MRCRNWVPGEPKDQAGGMEKCGMWMVNNGKLSDTNCDLPVYSLLQTRYVCERTPGTYGIALILKLVAKLEARKNRSHGKG